MRKFDQCGEVAGENQQEDGDGLPQCIVTNLSKGSRKGFTDGLRDFIKVDNHRSLEVGELHRDTGTFKVRKPKVPEGGSDITIMESLDELILRAEEVNTLKAYIDVGLTKRERWGPPLVDADQYASCHALYKGIEGEDWEEMYDSYKAMSKALGVKKPQEAQKAKAQWAMKAAKDRKEESYEPARQDNIFGRITTRLELWEEHLKDPIMALDKARKCVEDQY